MPNVIEGCGDPRTAEPALLEYSSATFNDLRGPGEAFRSLKELKGDDAIPTCIREVFDHHNMSEKFGVTLLHRHFDIDESERLVAVNDTSTPWGCEAYNNHALGKVLPQAFIFASPDKIVPFEYTFFTRNLLDNVTLFESATKAFLTELGLCLFSLQLDKVLGLRVHPGSQKKLKLEFTVNRANINIDMDKEASFSHNPIQHKPLILSDRTQIIFRPHGILVARRRNLALTIA
ncbi:hypothetical protein BYT27DRAFT_7253403 [Phlegmacium glaucopus]|nr:hypothetical protein BYT27DRAFT_7253403 [Phlegmacium glaucopus]